MPGLSEWAIIAIANSSTGAYLFIGSPARGGTLYGAYNSAGIETAAYRFGLSDNTLTVSTNDRGIYFENTTTYAGGTNNHIIRIYGLVKKPR